MDHINAGTLTHELIILYRNALIVAIQCVFALRRRNLSEMALGRNLVVDNDVVHLVFTTRDTKNYVPVKATFPDFLKPYLLIYLDRHRAALLAGHQSDAVWINLYNEPLEYGAMAPYFSLWAWPAGLHG